MRTEAAQIERLLPLIESELDRRLPRDSTLSPRLIDAMRYSVLGGGKRIRPLLTCACALSLGSDVERALAPACAVEFMHAYSLIHDDLPAMDDDDLRRGRATVHIAFDEATAILAGDALQALAFETLINAPPLSAETRVAMIDVLARAVGSNGMVGGQAFDIGATGHAITLDALAAMHRAKTGALLAAAVDLGALSAGADARTRAALTQFSVAVGLAFQVVDDLLDATSTTAAIGKRAGADSAAGKTTFPSLLGVEATRRRAAELLDEGLNALRRADITSGPLPEIARKIVERTN
jgi:geranylgeranyl diphosphate synthase type II